MKRTSFWVLVLEGLIGLHRTIQLQLLGNEQIILGFLFVCLFVFLKLHPSSSFWTLVDYDGYSISSEGFLPAVVDIMVI